MKSMSLSKDKNEICEGRLGMTTWKSNQTFSLYFLVTAESTFFDHCGSWKKYGSLRPK